MIQPGKKKLTSLNDMFGDDSDIKDNLEQTTEQMDITKLVPFEKHPFHLYTGARLDDMVKSVKELGVLTPLLVRKHGLSEYEILSGHNRWNAAKVAGLEKVPVIVMDDINDDEAMLIVTETNIIQRAFVELLPSEKAFVLAKHQEALKCQGKRHDLINEVKRLLNADEMEVETTSGHGVNKLKSSDIVGQGYDMSGRNVARYIRLTMLNKKLLEMIDSGYICFKAGVEISYLSEDNQAYLVGFLDVEKILDTDKAIKLHELEKSGKLNEVVMEKILDGTYKPKKPKSILKGYKIESQIMKKYFKEGQKEEEVKSIIDKALELYFETHQGGA